MIYSLLYSSKLFNENKYRNTIIYTIGTIFYTIIHWLLFSSIGNNNVYIQKYRYALYFIVAGDLVYVGSKYKESWCNANVHVGQRTCPTIEKIDERNECVDGKCTINHHPKHASRIENNEITQKDEHMNKNNMKDDIVDKTEKKLVDVKSDISLPVYGQTNGGSVEQKSVYLPSYDNKQCDTKNISNVNERKCDENMEDCNDDNSDDDENENEDEGDTQDNEKDDEETEEEDDDEEDKAEDKEETKMDKTKKDIKDIKCKEENRIIKKSD